jgi:hypothetical protein
MRHTERRRFSALNVMHLVFCLLSFSVQLMVFIRSMQRTPTELFSGRSLPWNDLVARVATLPTGYSPKLWWVTYHRWVLGFGFVKEALMFLLYLGCTSRGHSRKSPAEDANKHHSKSASKPLTKYVCVSKRRQLKWKALSWPDSLLEVGTNIVLMFSYMLLGLRLITALYFAGEDYSYWTVNESPSYLFYVFVNLLYVSQIASRKWSKKEKLQTAVSLGLWLLWSAVVCIVALVKDRNNISSTVVEGEASPWLSLPHLLSVFTTHATLGYWYYETNGGYRLWFGRFTYVSELVSVLEIVTHIIIFAGGLAYVVKKCQSSNSVSVT